MKTYKLLVEVYVNAEDQEEAESIVSDEFDYVFGLDNQLTAYAFDYRTSEEQGE